MDVGADHAVAPMQTVTAATLGVIGALGLAVALFVTDGRDAVLALVLSSLFVALFWGGFMWLAFRTRLVRRRGDLPVVDRPDSGSRRQAVWRGVISAVVLAVAVIGTAGVLALVGIEDTSGVGISLGIVLGAAVWLALQARDLRRWEAQTSLRLYTRSGARRFAWTGDQAQAKLVLVRASRP